MFDRKTVKRRAKIVLVYSFITSIFACMIVTIVTSGGMSYINKLQELDTSGMSAERILKIYSVIGAMAILGLAISVFIAGPLKVGLKYYMLKCCDMEVKLDNLLYPFKANFKNVIWVTFVRNLYVFLWSLLGLIPSAIILLLFETNKSFNSYLTGVIANVLYNESFVASVGFALVTGLLLIITLIFTIPAFIKELQYTMVDYILAEDANTPRKEALERSKEMMVGNKWAYVKLIMSFVGWALLASAVCYGLGLLILMPYMEATYAQVYLELCGKSKDYTTFDSQNNYQNPFGGFGNM